MISTFELYLQFLFDDHTSLTLDLELQNYDLEMLLQLPSLILYIKGTAKLLLLDVAS